jgi:hypothetical protein
MNELLDLSVYICSDGSLLSYDKNGTIHPLYTNLTSWSTLHRIHDMNILSSRERKGRPKDKAYKYIRYYFKNVSNDNIIEIPLEHISKMLTNIVKDSNID